MPKLTVRFLDDEVVEGTADDVNLDSPDFHLKLADGSSNNVGAWIPLPAVKKINLGSGPADAKVASADKMVAVRFQDGEIVRGYLNGTLKHHQYGLTMTLYSVDKQTMDTIAIPYTSLKALFYLKSWDSRPPGFWRDKAQSPPLTHLIGDIREVTRLYRAGSISREEFLQHRRQLLDHF